VVKSSTRSGPGPNYFSDSSRNVWVDRQGRLHLRLTHVNGHWYCAEVISERLFGRGRYSFRVDSPLNDLDPQVVVGLFTWNDNPAFDDREIDRVRHLREDRQRAERQLRRPAALSKTATGAC
jgi:hypothetical protein